MKLGSFRVIQLSMESTPLAVVAEVSRLVTMIVDRQLGDRSDFPLVVAVAAQQALNRCEIASHVFYGKGAWIEILSDQTPIWAGAWECEDRPHFWLATQFGEIVDLNASASSRKKYLEGSPEWLDKDLTVLHSAPMLWAAKIPSFYRYQPIGHVELDQTDEKSQKVALKVARELEEKLSIQKVKELLSSDAVVDASQFANESILTPDLKILDDSYENFKHFDRALAIKGLPPVPF